MSQSAIILIFDPAGKVLVLRRSRTDPWRPLHWNFPGGYLKSGETPLTAVVRELAEESSIRLRPETIERMFAYKHSGGLTHVFRTQLDSRPSVSFTDGEHDQHQWTLLHRIPEPVIPGLRRVVKVVAPRCEQPEPSDLVRRAPSGESRPGGRVEGWPKEYAYWPKYLPFPLALKRSRGWVPNSTAVNWPQSQFAPLFLPPGSASFQPFIYPANGTAAAPLYRLESLNYEGHSMVGPGGDTSQLPPPFQYGDHMSYAGIGRATFNPSHSERAHFNPEEAVAQILDTPIAAASTEAVVAAVTPAPATPAPVVPVASEATVAAVVVADSPFTPFAPELLVGLKASRLAQYQKLESVLTKLSAVERGSVIEATYQHLLKVHDTAAGKLEKRLERRATRKGRRHHVHKFIKGLRARRAAHKFKHHDVGGHGIKDLRQDVHQIHQVREAYQAGKIGREQAERLLKVAVRT